jgi:hypothetical protein
MSTTDTRTAWINTYDRLAANAEAYRDSQSVSFGLLAAYDELSKPERECVIRVLAEWFASDDNRLRYDAGFLASERKISELRPAVEAAIEKLQGRTGPGAVNEVKKLRRILAELS